MTIDNDSIKLSFIEVRSSGHEIHEYLKKENHFCVVEITPYRIEYLKLQQPEHLRVRFSKSQELWSGEFLVP